MWSDTEREFREKFVYNDGGPDWQNDDAMKLLKPSEILSFFHSKQQALLGEIKKEVEGIRIKYETSSSCRNALDEVLSLLSRHLEASKDTR